jgi:Mg2+ and Co2+ transporter CorA
LETTNLASDRDRLRFRFSDESLPSGRLKLDFFAMATIAEVEKLAALIAEAVGVLQIVTVGELRDLIAPLKFFWLDVFAGDEAVQTEVLAELGLDATDISWALGFDQVPGMAIGQHGLRVVTWLAPSTGEIVEAHFLCAPRWVVTVWNGDPAALDEARRHFVDRAAELEKNHFYAAAIVLQLLLATLDHMITILDTTLQAIREQLHRAPDTQDFATLTSRLQRLQSRWADFDRYSSAVRSAIVGVEAVPGMNPQGAAELNDYVEQVEDTEHRLHDRSGWASTILQEHAAAVAKRQADQINRLTLVSMIFLPLTFITGFFGMNFGWMAQIISSADAFVLLGVILPTLCVALTFVWLRRSKLIRWGKESHPSTAKLHAKERTTTAK